MLTDYLRLVRVGHYSNMPNHNVTRGRLSAHYHTLIWVLAGRGFARIGGRQYEAGRDHLFCFPKNEPHEYGTVAADPWEILWIIIDGELAWPFVERIQEFGRPMTILTQNDELQDRWMELVVLHDEYRKRAVVRTDTGVVALLGLIIDRLEMQQASPSQRIDVHRLQKFIHDHLQESITLDELAHEANLSRSQFTHVFRRLFHISPMQYVLRTRIARACSLLAETSMPLKQISEAVGCEDTHYFSRLFRKMTGQSPSEYRESKHPPAPFSRL